MTNYLIGKDRYVYKGTEKTIVTKSVYVETYLRYLSFHGEIKEVRIKNPYTVQFLEAQYSVLYENKDIELDEDVLYKSLREVGREQKKNTPPKNIITIN